MPQSNKANAIVPSSKWLDKTWYGFDWKRHYPLKPKSFQYNTVSYLLTHLSPSSTTTKTTTTIPDISVRRFLALWDMGLGKTFLSILWAECMMCQLWRLQRRFVWCVVVAAPTLQENFRNTLRSYGRTESYINTCFRFWSFELALKQKDSFVRDCKHNLIVIDEIQRIRTVIGTSKNGKATGGCAKSVIEGCKKASYGLTLTGTLIVNSLTDILNISQLLIQRRPDEEELRDALNRLFVVSHLKKGTPLSVDQMMVLRRIFERHLSHQTVVTANVSMPKSTKVLVVLEMNDEFYPAYKRVENDEADKLREVHNETDIKGSGAFWSGLRQAANKINSVPSQKRQFVLEKIVQAKAERKRVVITSSFLSRGLYLLIRSFPQYNIRFAAITGETPTEERQTAVNTFNDPKSKIDVIVLSGAGTTGTNLTLSSIQINLESLWNEATTDQTNARSVRLGSLTGHVIIYNLLMAKPEEFLGFVREVEDMIERKIPGAPDALLPVPSLHLPSSTAQVADASTGSGNHGLESIDIHLYRMQLQKSETFREILAALPTWAIESTEPSPTHDLPRRQKTNNPHRENKPDKPKTTGNEKSGPKRSLARLFGKLRV